MWPFKRKSSPGNSPVSSVKDAILVSGRNNFEGIEQEYELLDQRYGQRGVDWQLEQQSLHFENGRQFDRMDVMLKDGTKETVWFDITDIFGK